MIIFQTCTASSSKNPRESGSTLLLGHPDFSPSFLYTGLSSSVNLGSLLAVSTG